ncbi:chaperone NapD [Ferrimonas marina]|uniref:Chaperone NapD n=1 Tax=Ferrimonas marina TaxID=299255 RepID=A0A1M5NP92_9GAMM|nr:chaperone NapD [Ferrimonas marina]SHG90753.1 periplasmic nitrate reductase chaperone NapD [Ferrimonas marina]
MEYQVASLILQVMPGSQDTVHQYLDTIEGAQVHAQSADHQMVVTLEGEGDVLSPLESLSSIPGVLSVSLVSHHIDHE